MWQLDRGLYSERATGGNGTSNCIELIHFVALFQEEINNCHSVAGLSDITRS